MFVGCATVSLTRQGRKESSLMTERTTTVDELQAQLVAKAWDDNDFKSALISDPKATIGCELGVELPRDLEIQVVEERSNKVYLVLPVRPEAVSDDELSEEELEVVAGGVYTLTRGQYTPTRSGFGRLAILTTTMQGSKGSQF